MIWILFLGTFVTSLLAAARVKSNYLRFARVAASSGLTGAEAALEILRHANRSDNVAHLSCAIFSRFPTGWNRRAVIGNLPSLTFSTS